MAGDRTKIGIILEAFDKVTGPLKGVNAALDSIRRPVADIQKGFRSLSVAAGIPQMTKSIVGVGAAAGRVGSEVMALGRSFAIYGGLAAAGIGAVIHSAVEAASRLNDLSTSTGFGVGSLQTLGFAFGQVGGNAQMFEGAIEKFTQGMGQARAGTGKMAALLKRVDPALLSTIKKSKDTGDAFRAMLAGVSKAKTDADKFALAAAAVGKDAAGPIVNLAKEGPDGLKKLERMIGALSEGSVKAGDDLGDSMARLTGSFSLAKNSVVLGMAPALTKLSDKLADVLGNPEFIKNLNEWGKKFGDELPARIERLQNALGTLWNNYLRPVWDGLKWITADTDRLNIALGALAAVVSGKLLLAVGSLTGAFIKLGWAMLTTPIGWFELLIVGLGAAIWITWKHLMSWWSDLKAIFEDLYNKVCDFADLFGLDLDTKLRKLFNIRPEIKPTLLPPDEKLESLLPKDLTTSLLPGLEDMFGGPQGDAGESNNSGSTEKTVVNTVREIVKEQASSEKVGVAVDQAFARQKPSKVEMTVDFKNVPAGVRVNSRADSNVDLGVDVTYMGIQGAPA